jgi:hypothetical protein
MTDKNDDEYENLVERDEFYSDLLREEDLLGSEDGPVCLACGEPCTALRESFDYAGTHCTHGRSGTHYTGRWISDCCGADIGSADDYEEQQAEAASTYANHDGRFADND